MKKSPLDLAAVAGTERERRLRDRGDARRQRWGVVHTPAPLARWALARVDACLRAELGLAQGLASEEVGLLDVSVGTGVWLAAALEQAATRGGAPAAVVGYDRDGAAIRGCRQSLAVALDQAGWPCDLRQTNTLAERDPFPASVRVPVIVGNPPWATRSDSRDVEPTASWLADFRRDAAGQPLGERRVGVLSDDYVRFMRWAVEHARHHPKAVVCLATNGSFLDGPVHRGMRARLREWFDGIEVLDLGGNALLSRGAGRDGNVFGVRPGVALTLLWRGSAGEGGAAVRHARLRGSAAAKLAALDQGEVRAAPLHLSTPGAPWRQASATGVSRWPVEALALDVAMPFHREGVQTNRDAFAVAESRAALLAKMQRFAEGGEGPPARPHFDPERARAVVREALARDPEGTSWTAPLWYRPFELHHFVTLPAVSHRPRPQLLRATGHGAPCLLTARKDRGERTWSLYGACRGVADACFLSTRSSCRTRVFPARDPEGRANLNEEAVAAWLARSGVAAEACDAEALIELALAQWAAAGFRQRYDVLLRQDYPRLLPPAGADAFAALREVGRALLAALCCTAAEPAVNAPLGGTEGVGHFAPPGALEDLPPGRRAGWLAYTGAVHRANTLFAEGALLPADPG